MGVEKLTIDGPGNLTLRITFDGIEVANQMVPVATNNASS
jgi:hypothetical protein